MGEELYNYPPRYPICYEYEARRDETRSQGMCITLGNLHVGGWRALGVILPGVLELDFGISEWGENGDHSHEMDANVNKTMYFYMYSKAPFLTLFNPRSDMKRKAKEGGRKGICNKTLQNRHTALIRDDRISISSPYMYFFSGSILSKISMLFSYMVNTIPPLMTNRANLGNAPLQKVNTPSCLNIMAAQRKVFP